MRLVRLDNLNEMWELKRLYGINFVGVLNGYQFYKIHNNNIISIEEDIASELLKLNSLIKLKLVVAAMYFEVDED
ncbi:hypothetical protein MCANPG14_02321 [Mycoplasmopsis canis PG 14]|uniref:hypothetical protein n=1 Tax=Mycoplasmopsis canis TaxID=29555 RepID=UPI00025AEC1B|nr:hypothetical protein [Mycoplasmopsis canis]EIE39867.1 hypothetical protein MCANPG14_02321 [Mycoplasmopsis canis PG 14]